MPPHISLGSIVWTVVGILLIIALILYLAPHLHLGH